MKLHTKTESKTYVTGITYTGKEFEEIIKDSFNSWELEINIPNTDGWVFGDDTSVKITGEVTLMLDPEDEYGLPEKIGVTPRTTKKKVAKK